MTTTLQLRPPRSARPTRLGPLPYCLLAVAAAAAFLGEPVVTVIAQGGLLFWALGQAGSEDPAERSAAYAFTLVSLAGLVGLCLPRFLPPSLDHLLVVSLVGLPLLWLCLTTRTVRQALPLRRPVRADLIWLVGCFVGASLLLPLVTDGASAGRLSQAELAAVTVLVVIVPMVNEALFRGLLMRGTGDGIAGVLLVATVQALAVAPVVGVVGMVMTGVLGLALGSLRAYTGWWQTALAAHWGLSLAAAAALLMATGVGA
jgi:membrane protease YdiL (CAAX protease family)